MGILIAIGVTVIGVTIYRRATDRMNADRTPSASAPQTPAQAGAAADVSGSSAPPGSAALSLKNAAPMSFGSRDLELPPGSEILSVQTVSLQPGVERVLVYARLPDGGSRILVLDPLRGNIGGEWRVPGASQSGATPRP